VIYALIKSLAVNEARNGVRVNEVKPGHIINSFFKSIFLRLIYF